MIDVLDSDVRLVPVSLRVGTILTAAIGQHAQQFDTVLLEEPKHPVIEQIRGRDRRLAMVKLGAPPPPRLSVPTSPPTNRCTLFDLSWARSHTRSTASRYRRAVRHCMQKLPSTTMGECSATSFNFVATKETKPFSSRLSPTAIIKTSKVIDHEIERLTYRQPMPHLRPKVRRVRRHQTRTGTLSLA